MSEIDAISQLFNNINEKDSSNKKYEKSNINKKKCCVAAVKISTIGRAFKNILDNVSVYLVKDKKNNILKTNAYIRCSKTIEDNCNYCHLHFKVLKTNPDGIQDFEKDIIPKGYLANVNDDYFINMGKRGAKKKNNKNTFTFNNSNNPILLILTHKNPKLTVDLMMYAQQILKGNNDGNSSIQYNELKPDKKIKSSHKKLDSLDNLFSIISEIDLNSNNKLSNTDIEKINSMKNKLSGNNTDSDEELENSSDNEEDLYDKNKEEVSCDEIYTTKNKLLWYNEDNNTVYEPEGDDNGEEIGILKEIHIDHHTILHNGKFYTVLKEIFEKKHGKIYCCSLTNKLFNRDLEYIGNQKKIKNNEYQMIFFNEI